ncbi:hypothetical protein CDD83_719 [Cordyceps sp. RAO-2017]|nr:hypothetical protein CDD83_719 [Cordyceps sp. RAO-2017]
MAPPPRIRCSLFLPSSRPHATTTALSPLGPRALLVLLRPAAAAAAASPPPPPPRAAASIEAQNLFARRHALPPIAARPRLELPASNPLLHRAATHAGDQPAASRRAGSRAGPVLRHQHTTITSPLRLPCPPTTGRRTGWSVDSGASARRPRRHARRAPSQPWRVTSHMTGRTSSASRQRLATSDRALHRLPSTAAQRAGGTRLDRSALSPSLGRLGRASSPWSSGAAVPRPLDVAGRRRRRRRRRDPVLIRPHPPLSFGPAPFPGSAAVDCAGLGS